MKGGKGWEEGRGCEGGKKEGREGTSIREGGGSYQRTL